MHAHHRDLCRFESKENQNFLLVEGAIKELVSGSVKPKGKRSNSMTEERAVVNLTDWDMWQTL